MSLLKLYNDTGVSTGSLHHTIHTCEQLWPRARIKTIAAAAIIQANELDATEVLVFPGGADIPYRKALNGIGNDNIRAFIESGKTVLGICAGSYYLSGEVQFALGTSIEVHEKRELKFFSGIARGPHISPFDYQSLTGVKAVAVHRKGLEPLRLYYHGGGCFLNASKAHNTRVIATYDAEGKDAAIIECKVGKGKAILSALHVEYDPMLGHSDLKSINNQLRLEDGRRRALFQSLLS